MSPKAVKPIVHSKWLKGLQAGFDRYSQPKGSAARVSNMVLTRRGAWKTCDGSVLITIFDNMLQPSSANFGPITEVYLYQPVGAPAGYFGIVKNIVATASVCQFYAMVAPIYNNNSNLIFTFPADAIPKQGGGAPGGYGGSGSGGGGTSGNQPPTPVGGVTGNLSPLPQIVGFVNKMMMALGNGLTPYISDGTTVGTVQIANSFTATYPTWAASTVFNQGDQLEATVSAVSYVFTAVQGGVTNSSAHPTWPATLGATVTDNNIIWKNSGQVSGSPPPRGAAHAEIYAGSLWVANTGIVMSADSLDGPSAIRMSDLNNPLSWNPLNAAQISPDDGDQCTGIKAFTVAEAGIAPQNFLMYFKNFSSYLIQGVFGSSNFAITRLQTDLGCVAPRSLQFVPGYGIMRLSHLGFAVTDGISDKLQDPEAIRPYLFPESTETDILGVDQTYLYFSKAAQTANPPMYVCAVPLLGQYSGILNGITTSVAYNNRPPIGIPAGNYYVIVQATLSNGIVALSGEIPITAVSQIVTGEVVRNVYPQYLQVNIPFNPLIVSWNLYVGTSSGSYNGFIPSPGSVTSVIYDSNVNLTPGMPAQSQNGQLTRIFCYDLILKAWTVVDLPFPISVLKQFRTPGSAPITVMGGFYDGALRSWQSGNTAWDNGATINGNPTTVAWSFRDMEVFTEGGGVLMFHNQVIMRGDGGPTSISVAPTLNGKVLRTVQAAITALGNNQYEARARILKRAENLNLTISGTGPAVVESVLYEVDPKPVGASLILS